MASSGYFAVKNWDKFQHYKDRNPPWIKLHRELLTDYEFACLQDASKLHLMMIWLFASQCNNRVPNDPAFLKNALHFDAEPDLKELNRHGFIEFDSNALASCKQSAMTETETETETERDCVEYSTPANGVDFEKFWKHWPVKRNKQKAKQAFIRKKFNVDDVDLLITDVNNRIAHDDQWKRGYIPHCSTYLNGHRWEDEYENSKTEKTRR